MFYRWYIVDSLARSDLTDPYGTGGYATQQFFEESESNFWAPSIETDLQKLMTAADKKEFETARDTVFTAYGKLWFHQYQDRVYVTMNNNLPSAQFSD